jgi:hypothetical protein
VEQRVFIGHKGSIVDLNFLPLFFVAWLLDSNVKLKFLTPSIIVVPSWVGLLNMVPLSQIA